MRTTVRRAVRQTVLGTAAAVLAQLAGVAAATVSITSLETWDGTLNPHAADGVILSGGVYTIPNGMTISGSGQIQMFSATPTPNVTFRFPAGSGGLSITNTLNTFDIYEGTRDATSRLLTFEMNDNDLTAAAGGGNFYSRDTGRDGMSVKILSSTGGDITLGTIGLNHHDSEKTTVEIVAGGNVTVGSINTSDGNAGGNAGGDVTIRAPTVTVGPIWTYSDRTSSSTANGSIMIEALGYPAFDEAVAPGNHLDNTLALLGLLATEHTSGFDQAGGDVTLRAVRMTLGAGFSVTKETDALLNLYAGVAGYNMTAGDLFIDNAPGVYTATHNVQWVPEPGTLCLLAGAGLLGLRRRR